MRLALTILCLSTALYSQSYIPNAYRIAAKEYYDLYTESQWQDVRWHIREHGYRNATYASMEGSNIPQGKHPDEDSFQCAGIYYPAARLFRSHGGLRDSLRSHAYAAGLSAEIDSHNLALERKRGSLRPELNATMRYPGGSKWRSRLKYGLVFMARQSELKKRSE